MTQTALFPRPTPNTETDEWYTPPQVVDAAREAMGNIDLDPASCEEANKTVRATKYYDVAEDGLTLPWEGRIWCNPPFSEAAKWADRFLTHIENGSISTACFLGPMSSSNWVMRGWEQAAGVCLLPAGRTGWYGPSSRGNGQNPWLCEIVLIFGCDPTAFKQIGKVR